MNVLSVSKLCILLVERATAGLFNSTKNPRVRLFIIGDS